MKKGDRRRIFGRDCARKETGHVHKYRALEQAPILDVVHPAVALYRRTKCEQPWR